MRLCPDLPRLAAGPSGPAEHHRVDDSAIVPLKSVPVPLGTMWCRKQSLFFLWSFQGFLVPHPAARSKRPTPRDVPRFYDLLSVASREPPETPHQLVTQAFRMLSRGALQGVPVRGQKVVREAAPQVLGQLALQAFK